MVCQQEGVEKLEDEIAGAWAAFAHTGNPNHKNLSGWTPFENGHGVTMVFCEDSRPRMDFDTELIKLKKELDPSFQEKMAKLFQNQK